MRFLHAWRRDGAQFNSPLPRARADELLAESDVKGVATSRAILRAIEELERTVPRQGERVN